MVGRLSVSGLGKFLFPSPAHTIVRTMPLEEDRVHWLRSFSGRVFLESTYERSNREPASLAAVPLHDTEAVWPLKFTFDMEPEEADSSGNPVKMVAPRHVSTSLLGLVPLPPSLVTVSLTMAMHDDDQGWDLVADVSALNGLVRLIRYEGPMRNLTALTESPPPYVVGFHHLILYDGVCNLCNASVDFIVQHDAAQRFIFVAQQSAAAADALKLAGHELPSLAIADGGQSEGNGDSVLLLTPDGQLHERSAAALRCGLALDWPWPLLAAMGMLLPPPLRDAMYNFVGRNRYRWFGRSETCRLPNAAERRRFL